MIFSSVLVAVLEPDLSLFIVDDQPDFLVVYKPPGLITHGNEANTSLLTELKRQLGAESLHPAHRLDKDTSGLLLIAKNAPANQALSLLFQNRLVHKAYLGVSEKRPKKSQGEVRGDMEKSRNGSWRLTRGQANPAITQFKTAGLGNGHRLVFMKPLTGKTHQLRVAMKSLGAPLIGDQRYSGVPSDRMYLHALHLSFMYQDTPFTYRVMPKEGDLFLTDAFLQVCTGFVAAQFSGDQSG